MNRLNDDEDGQGWDATVTDLVEIDDFPIFNCMTRLGSHVVSNDLDYARYSGKSPATRWRFFYPPHQRAHGILQIQLPRDMDATHNPDHQRFHIVLVKFPAQSISGHVNYSAINNSNLPVEFNRPEAIEGIGHHLITLEALDCVVSGGNLPKLVDDALQQRMQEAMSFAQSQKNRTTNMQLTIVFEGDDVVPKLTTDEFNCAIDKQRAKDPLMAFYELVPNARVLQLGSIIDYEARPDLPVQPAQLVFGDSMEYQLPHIMGATYEQEFRDFAINDYESVQFDSSWMELSISKTDPAKPANAYMIFVRGNVDLEKLQHGDQVKIRLVGDKFQTVPNSPVDPADEATDKAMELDRTTHDDEYWDIDSEPDDQPNVWGGVVTDTVLCPAGYFCLIVERPRVSGWEGTKEDRPFIDTIIPCVTDQAPSLEGLKTVIENNESIIQITIEPAQDRQAYKDDIRSISSLFSSQDEGKRRLRDYILGRWDPQERGQTTSILDSMGGVDNLTDFTPSQLDMYNSLGNITQKIALLHGPYGTGKTDTTIKIIVKYLSNARVKHQVLYCTGANIGVDDAARRCVSECERCGLKKKIIRAHSLKGEKAKMVKSGGHGQSRFRADLPENILQEFLSLEYVNKVATQHHERRKRGDPRRVLEDLSLTQAMLNYLRDNGDNVLSLRQLRTNLTLIQHRGPEGFDMVDLKSSITTLMKLTLADADVIFCTINAASKVNLYENFKPGMVVCDEACRATEVSTMSLLAFYDPSVWIFAGDHKQLRPVVLSADLERKSKDGSVDEPRFRNPFHKQLLMSFMHRMITIGHPVTFLAEQHRLQGGSSAIPSRMFYNGRVVDAQQGKLDSSVIAAREFTRRLGLPVGRNMILLAVDKSKSSKAEGSHSLTNLDHILAAMRVIDRALGDETLVNRAGRPMTITVTAMYKAQVALYMEHIENGFGKAARQRLTIRTVDGMQGYEDDIVIVDMVRSHDVGFTGQQNRFNVALTRHRFLLVVVMNTDMLPKAVDHPERRPALKFIKQFIDLHERSQLVITVIAASHTCHICQETGHKAEDCPQKERGTCFRCGEEGHAKKDCPQKEGGQCFRCGEEGHVKKDCPHKEGDQRNQHGETHGQCFRCGEEGHTKKDCPNPKVARCMLCHKFGHTKSECPTVDPSTLRCNRCRETGHIVQNCTRPRRKLGLLAIRKKSNSSAITSRDDLYKMEEGREDYEMEEVRDCETEEGQASGSVDKGKGRAVGDEWGSAWGGQGGMGEQVDDKMEVTDGGW